MSARGTNRHGRKRKGRLSLLARGGRPPRKRRIQRARRTPNRRAPARLDWTTLSDRQLLNLRLSDLGLKIEGTALERRIVQLNDELKRRGLRFRPHFWLSTEWFCPD